MKKLIILISALSVAFSAVADTLVNGTDQAVIIPPGAKIIQVPGGYEVVTNSEQFTAPSEWYTPFTNAWDSVVSGSSNMVFTVAGVTLTSGDKKGTAGAAFFVSYNIVQYVATGVGFYYLGSWTMFNGQVQLLMPLPLSPKIRVTPGILGGVGTSLSGSGSANGQVTVISQFFINVDFIQLGGWTIGAGGFWGTVTGAGPYSGNDAGGFLKGSRGF
jgi:hypothetical protein